MPNKTWPSAASGSRGSDAMRGFKTQVDSFFEDWFGRSMGGMIAPRADISETDSEVLLDMELPGVNEQDVEVTLAGDQITVKGEKKSEHRDRREENGRTFHRTERSYGAFQRTMTVPHPVDPDLVTAQFKDGVLTIALPKPADAVGRSQARQIPINRSQFSPG